MIKRQLSILFFFSWGLLILLVSCTPRIMYEYNNVSYETPEPALAAQRAEIDAIQSKITPKKESIGGSAIIILPSKQYIEQHFLVWRGPDPSQEFKENIVNFYAALLINSWRARGHALDKYKIFNKVVFGQTNDPENTSFNEDIALLLFKRDNKDQWFMRKKTNPSNLITIEEISTSLPPVQRLLLWLDNVEKLANRQ